jgi:hypothetical protein
MLIDSLPTKVTSSFKVSPSRPPETLVLVEPSRPARSEYDEQALTGIGTPRDERRRVPDKARGSPMARANTSQAVSACEIRGKPQFVRKPSDWMAGSQASLVQHGPTETVFEIFARPDLGPDDALTVQDFRARLARRGAAAPTDADLEVLSGDAVLMCFSLASHGLSW